MALFLIFNFVSMGDVWEGFRRLPLPVWLAALVLFLAGHALSAAKWALLIDARLPFGRIFRAHLAGLAANLALPGVAGGDVVRAGLVYNLVPEKGRLAAGSLADRLIDTLALLLITLAGAWALWGGAVSFIAVAWRLAAIALPVGALLLATARFERFWPRHFAEYRSRPIRLAAKLANACAQLAAEPWRLVACLAISLAVQTLFVAINAQIAGYLDLQIAFAGWAYAWAGAKIVAILPISLGGLGVREGTMAMMLQPHGGSPRGVVATGLLWQTILYASGVLGLLVQTLAERPAAAAEPAPQEPA
ncbi:flippase-like domain-containing protein [Altererythrobacter salegens]|uniref:Flippase-like domain-containing protein n=1 Tax=Croceibacterium salegens TaxID=1737568 RepID=A0A6I4T254_9SPHN|nr:flippase-like domain-containing protein [Croceibacterium salegens]